MADFFAKGKNPINGYGGVDEGVIYSTEEHIIGKWIDGSTLYEKTVDCGTLPNATVKNVAHGISNLKEVTSITGVCASTIATYTIPFAMGGGSNVSTIRADVDTTNIVITTSYNASGITKSYITIRYTKTS